MIELIAERDLDLVAAAVDVVERHAGQPWRTALEHLDDLQRAEQPASARRFSAIVSALQRLTGGRARNAQSARRARGLVLGHPALTTAERQGRIDHAALMLGTDANAIELMLWSDLPRERPIVMPAGRPSELEVAAFANVALLQRALRRAQSLVLAIRDDDPSLLVRAAAQRGLLVTTAVDAGETTLHIAGPLSLCHQTSVYGRALADIVPLLGALHDWTLEVRVELPLASYSTHVSSPALLPAPPARLVAPPPPVTRLVRGLERADASVRVMPFAPAIRAGSTLLWPDLEIAIGARRIFVELVGFWTRPYLDARLVAYHAAGVDVIVCVDAARGTDERTAAHGRDDRRSELPPEVLAYTRLVPIDTLLERVRGAR